MPEDIYTTQLQLLQKIGKLISHVNENVEQMVEARKVSNGIADTREKAISYNTQVKDKYFDEIRYSIDKLELLVADDEWTLPKYRELLFLR